MAASWDQRSAAEQARTQNALLRQTVVHMALGHVPYVRALMAEIGIDARGFAGLRDLRRIPLTMRSDVFDPARNPEGASGMELRSTTEGLKRFGDRGVLWRVALSRLLGGEESEARAIEAATRPIHVHLADGPGGPIPIAYTRDDLDVLARAGARLSQVLGLSRDDRLLNLVPFGPTLDFWGIFYAAHGSGVSAVHARTDGAALAAALHAFLPGRATVVALPAGEVVRFPAAAADAGLDAATLRAVIAVGRSLSQRERTAATEALAAHGAPEARIAAAYGVAEGRVLWGECAVPPGHTETYGFHTYPDLDLVEVVSPETGMPVGEEAPGEIVVTPLGFRGGGAPRWRSGDLALGGLTTQRCPNCGRTVPRVGPGVGRAEWRRAIPGDGRTVEIDLRELGAVASRVASDWQIEFLPRDGVRDLYVYVAAPSDDAEPVIDLYERLERTGLTPAQVVLATREEIAARRARAGGSWPGYWER